MTSFGLAGLMAPPVSQRVVVPAPLPETPHVHDKPATLVAGSVAVKVAPLTSTGPGFETWISTYMTPPSPAGGEAKMSTARSAPTSKVAVTVLLALMVTRQTLPGWMLSQPVHEVNTEPGSNDSLRSTTVLRT